MTDLSKLSIPELRAKHGSIYSLSAFDELAERYRRLEEAQISVPEGWKLVPVEPTEEMCLAGSEYVALRGLACSVSAVFRAMLSAAPLPPIQQSKSQYRRLVAQGAIKEGDMVCKASGQPSEMSQASGIDIGMASAIGAGSVAGTLTITGKEVSDVDK